MSITVLLTVPRIKCCEAGRHSTRDMATSLIISPLQASGLALKRPPAYTRRCCHKVTRSAHRRRRLATHASAAGAQAAEGIDSTDKASAEDQGTAIVGVAPQSFHHQPLYLQTNFMARVSQMSRKGCLMSIARRCSKGWVEC